MPISSYFFNQQDEELRYLANYLVDRVSGASDVRDVHKSEYKVQSIVDLALQAQLNCRDSDLSPRTTRQYMLHMERSKEMHRSQKMVSRGSLH